jgi:acetoacetate decarboxylase
VPNDYARSMPELHGLIYPRTPTGAASIVPPPPWHYSGDMLTVEYRTDPANVAELLPDPLRPADDDPGAVAVVWAEWQSCSDSFDELLDPARAQYKEAFVVVRCQYEGQTYSRAAYIWVDKDFALARGVLQGYPKKLAEIWMTRPVALGVAGPRLAPGGRFGATVSTFGRRLVEARFTITGSAETAGFVNGHPMIHSRQMPSIELDGGDSLDELVTMRGYDVELGPVHSGTVELDLFDAPTEELTRLAPLEMIGGYYRQIATSWNGGSTLHAEPNPKADR